MQVDNYQKNITLIDCIYSQRTAWVSEKSKIGLNRFQAMLCLVETLLYKQIYLI